jgi:hypothetical protein
MGLGTLIWRGDAGAPPNHYSKSILRDITSAASLATLATFMLNHSDCNLARRKYQESVTVNDALPGEDIDVDDKGIIYMRNPADEKVRSVTIAGPVADDYTLEPEGYRYTAEALTAIVGAINTATGLSLIPLWGKRIVKT